MHGSPAERSWQKRKCHRQAKWTDRQTDRNTDDEEGIPMPIQATQKMVSYMISCYLNLLFYTDVIIEKSNLKNCGHKLVGIIMSISIISLPFL